MIRWPRNSPGALLAGIALIVASNAVALLGVTWNRAGPPESQLVLSERELQNPEWWRNRENSGITLQLSWRVPLPSDPRADHWSYPSTGRGAPGWLDAAKMRSLGFALPAAGDGSRAGGEPDLREKRQRTREVLLVLELDGPERHRSLAAAQARVEKAKALAAANPDKNEFKERLERAQEALTEEDAEASRLFAIDAGLDPATLRARYADRSRFAIVRARVGLWQTGGRGEDTRRGFIHEVVNDAVNVPLPFRPIFEREPQPAPSGGTARPQPFTATIAFGQRLEPWLVSATRPDKQ